MAADSLNDVDAVSDVDREPAQQAMEMLKSLRKNTTLGGLSLKALRDAGRPGMPTAYTDEWDEHR